MRFIQYNKGKNQNQERKETERRKTNGPSFLWTSMPMFGIMILKLILTMHKISEERTMKTTTTIFAVVLGMLAICNVAMAATINWGTNGVGAKDTWGSWLVLGDLAQLWQDVNKDGMDPWGIVGGDDVLLDTAAIGDGYMQMNGNFYADHTMTWGVNPGDRFYIRLFDEPAPDDDFWYWNGIIITAPDPVPPVLAVIFVPEPSFILVGGLVLLMVRKKK